MSFDFLPNKKTENTPSNGGGFSIGNNFFIDKYKNHLDAHKLISTPPNQFEFLLKHNFEVAQSVFNENKIKEKISSNFYGSNTTFDELLQGYTLFQDNKLLETTIAEIDSEITLDLFTGIEKPKMKISDKFGLFFYDLASASMRYVYEYFDKQGNKVDANFVTKINNKFYFENNEVEQKIKLRENGNPTVVSSVKKCYLDFEKKQKKERAVEIFVANSVAYNESASDFIYNSIAAISVAKNLILKGFKVKINALIISKLNSDYFFSIVPAKSFKETLDINAVAYVCGDPRFFRYQGFKMVLHGYDVNNKKSSFGLGSIINDLYFIENAIEKDYLPNSNLEKGDTRLYFGGSRNLNQAKNEVLQAIKILKKRYDDSKAN